jgi:hypothetical protein
MAISSISYQPGLGALKAAYRPIVFRVLAVATDNSPIPPVVYCDIYFNSLYYKTLSRTHYYKLFSTNSEWEFDIEDACQEFLSKFVGASGGSVILNAGSVITSVFCKFRSSGLDSNGFVQHEGTKPIQSTGDVQPVAGTGTSSEVFYAVNATLQQEDQQSLSLHLASYKISSWNSECFPLTHRPNPYIIGRSDSDYYPIIDKNNGAGISQLALNYRLVGQSTMRRSIASYGADGYALYIPSGPKNLQVVFPTINFQDVDSYFLELLGASSSILATSCSFKIDRGNCNERIRIHFQNYLGTIDAVNFHLVTREHETKSDSYEVPLRAPLDRMLHGVNRFNVKSNDTFQVVCTDYGEEQMEWIDELMDSPNAWIEQKGIQGQTDTLSPIVVLDKKVTKQKEDERFINEIAVDFRFSNPKILIRN